MFEILKKYSNANKFEFGQNERLSEVCNAPTDRSGVYLVFDSFYMSLALNFCDFDIRVH